MENHNKSALKNYKMQFLMVAYQLKISKRFDSSFFINLVLKISKIYKNLNEVNLN